MRQQPYIYVYFDENHVPYYVAAAQAASLLDRGEGSVE